MKKHPLFKIIEQQKSGKAIGIYSACSAHPLVLEACMEKALHNNSFLLIESTANQVDQHGGYTGMTPSDFYCFIERLAKKVSLPMSQIILGGDHLGPLTFSSLPEKEAMAEAKELVSQYVLAGFTKIHLDTSMRLKDDPCDCPLSNDVIARRGAELAQVAEEAYESLLKKNPEAIHPVFIVGSEVPIPGGAQEESSEGIQVTQPDDFKSTVETFKQHFLSMNLETSWNHVIAVVVQPGVEEKDSGCTDYDPIKAADLMASLKDFDSIVFEGHSTDYQTQTSLRQLVTDGVGILKVGPGLTFALREAIFSLAFIEQELLHDQPQKQSNFIKKLEEAMLAEPKYWQKYYHGNDSEIAIKRKFSFSDRCRYYLPKESIQASFDLLIKNLSTQPIPLNLLSQFMPLQYRKVRNHQIDNNPLALIKDYIGLTIEDYLQATNQEKLSSDCH